MPLYGENYEVKVTVDDTDPAPLDSKLTVTGPGLAKGVVNPAADEDLQLTITVAAPSQLTPDAGNQEGAADSLARSDHIHDVPAAAATNIEAGGTSVEGVSTSFARADHVHRIIDPSTEVTATDNISTTSTTPVTATGMTITPGAGTYLVWFSTWGLHTNNNAEVLVGLAVDGTDITASQRHGGDTAQSDNQTMPVSTQARITVTAGQEIQGRYWVDGGGSAQINHRSLMLLKVDT